MGKHSLPSGIDCGHDSLSLNIVMSGLDNMKTALVTGALGKTGSMICERLVDNGYFVIGTDVKAGSCRCASFVNVNLRKLLQEKSRSSFEQYVRSLTPSSRLDLLVNNATIDEDKSFENVSLEDWHETLDVNLLVPFSLIGALQEQLSVGDGIIVNTGNLHAHEHSAHKHCYSATKSALQGLSRTIAKEFEGILSIYTVATHVGSESDKTSVETKFPSLVTDAIYQITVNQNRPESGTTITIG